MPYMKVVIDTMRRRASVTTTSFSSAARRSTRNSVRAVGADAYCRDAAIAVETAKDFLKRRHNQL